jgi:hypothetical protein
MVAGEKEKERKSYWEWNADMVLAGLLIDGYDRAYME